MSKRAKIAALATAGAFAAVTTFAGTASAGGPSTSPYNCVDTRGRTFTTKVTYSTGGGLLKVNIATAVPVSFPANSINTTVLFNGPSGGVVYDGTINPPYTAGAPVLNLGAIPKVSGTISPGQPLNAVLTGSPPSPSNWSLRVLFPTTSVPWPSWYCVTRTPLSPPLTYN
ncbi:hypothetical protein OG948_09555 [Embleya sp. NBC_00888]|uniref:hypothetical protein n=1 Tax=Embleya sp. NBC_00888 TaxID=2975960 RepID=UPI00386F5A77|nr:hypothetical protein OG948_09555 [Embleya sp. NBC_00888]